MNWKKFKKDFWTCLFFLFVCMYGLVIIACVSPIGQSEKNDQNINSKETRRGEGPEYSILFSKCIRKIMFYMFYMYLWNFIVGFFKVSFKYNTYLKVCSCSFVRVQETNYKSLNFTWGFSIIFIFFLILGVTFSWEKMVRKMQINFKSHKKC